MREGKNDIKYKTEEDIQRLERSTNREPNQVNFNINLQIILSILIFMNLMQEDN